MYTCMSYSLKTNMYRLVMVSMLASSAVDLGLEPQLGQIKDYQIGIGYF